MQSQNLRLVQKRFLLVLGGVISVFACTTAIAFGATTATLLPTGSGTYSSWTPSTGSTHYTLVDESTCNGNSDYVSETTVGDRDSFSVSLASVPDGATMTQIQVTPCASRNSNGSGSSVLNVFYRYNGANSGDQGSYALTGTTPTSLTATNFSSLSLKKSSTSTLEIGAVYTSGTKGARLSRLATVITYTPPPAPPTVATFDPEFLVGSSTTLTTLKGSTNPNGSSATGWFRYDTVNPGVCTNSFGTETPVGGLGLGSGTSSVAFSSHEFLSSGVTYYYCALSSNAGGVAVGNIVSFIVP